MDLSQFLVTVAGVALVAAVLVFFFGATGARTRRP